MSFARTLVLMMELTSQELSLLKSYLLARKMYVNHASVWQPWMGTFMDKVDQELKRISTPITTNEQV